MKGRSDYLQDAAAPYLSHRHGLILSAAHSAFAQAQTCGGADWLEIDAGSVQFSLSRSDCLWPHGLQHARPPCPSPTPGVYSNSCPSSRWCHPTISSSVVPFFSRLQSFPASGSFQMSQFFASGGQSIGVSASALTESHYKKETW